MFDDHAAAGTERCDAVMRFGLSNRQQQPTQRPVDRFQFNHHAQQHSRSFERSLDRFGCTRRARVSAAAAAHTHAPARARLSAAAAGRGSASSDERAAARSQTRLPILDMYDCPHCLPHADSVDPTRTTTCERAQLSSGIRGNRHRLVQSRCVDRFEAA